MTRIALLVAIVGCSTPEGAGGGDSQGADGTTTDSGADGDSGTTSSGIWRSALYPRGWAPGDAVGDAFLHDFSYAGYHAGEVPLPDITTDGAVSAIDHGADPSGAADSTAAIQAAIEAVGAAGGGVVHIPAGTYRLDGVLQVAHSGVVLAGDGPDDTRLGFTASSGMSDRHHLTFAGAVAVDDVVPLTADTAPHSFVVTVDDAGDLSPGDQVTVGWTITDEFVSDHVMDEFWEFSAGLWRPFFRRTVVAVDTDADPPTVTLDVPLRYVGKVRDGVALRRERGHLTECGLQGLAVSTAVVWESAWGNDRSHAIAFEGVQDCWMRDVASWAGPEGGGEFHLQSGGVIVSRSRRVTVADTTLQMAQNRGGGGNGYLFEVRQSGEVLIRDSVGRGGRHNFIQNWDFGTSGCVFLRTLSEGGEVYDDIHDVSARVGTSEYHHALAMANLVDDSVAHDGWKAVNRLFYSSGAGHTSTANVFWNTRGAGILSSYQWGLGYVIGTADLTVDVTVTDIYETIHTAPEDWVEGIDDGANLEPRSLYEDQLSRRLGGAGD